MVKIKVFIADDHSVVLEGLTQMINRTDDMQVIGTCVDGQKAIVMINKLSPDIVILDINMPELSGIEVTKSLRNTHPDLKIIILSMHEEEEYIVKSLEMGVNGYITKTSHQDEIIEGIRTVAKGESYFGCLAKEILMKGYLRQIQSRQSEEYKLIQTLTRREQEILKLIINGHSNREIAKKLFISKRTAENHRANILKKLQLSSTIEIIKWAGEKNISLG